MKGKEKPNELPPPPPPSAAAADAVSTAFDQLRAIVETCNKSQEIMNLRSEKSGVGVALAESQPYESMWEEYVKRFPQPVELRQASLSGLLFTHAKFKHHAFIGCDFSRSRWIVASLEDSNCTSSSFTGIVTLLSPFRNTNCTSCDFTGASINFFEPFQVNNFENANFTNAKILTAHSFFGKPNFDSRARFDNAIMNGCTFTIQREHANQYNKSTQELRSILEGVFSRDQLSVMRIDYQAKPGG